MLITAYFLAATEAESPLSVAAEQICSFLLHFVEKGVFGKQMGVETGEDNPSKCCSKINPRTLTGMALSVFEVQTFFDSCARL